MRGRWRRAIGGGPVEAPIGTNPPHYPLRSDMREAWHRGAWPCECGAAAWERRERARRGEAQARGTARVGDPRKAWSTVLECARLKRQIFSGFDAEPASHNPGPVPFQACGRQSADPSDSIRRRAGRIVQSGRATLLPGPALRVFITEREVSTQVTFFPESNEPARRTAAGPVSPRPGE